MKATGMIRRIDELGRIVIPKEIRKTLGIKMGDEMEIYTEDGGRLIMERHSRIVGFSHVGQGVVEAIYRSLGGTVLITDGSRVLYTSGAYRRVYDGKILTHEMTEIVYKRRSSIQRGQNIVDIVEGDTHDYSASYVAPIIAGGDLYGAIIYMLGEGDINSIVSVIDTASSFLALSLES